QLRLRHVTTPIIALTAHAMKGFQDEIMAVGFSGYLTKPIDIDALIEMLAGLLHAERLNEESGTTSLAENSTAEVSDLRTITEPPLVSRLAADNPRFQPIIEKFVRRLHEQLDAMAQAWNARNFEELARLGHWLKGAGGTVGFDAFTEPAAELEQFAKSENGEPIAELIAALRRLADRIDLSSPAHAQSATVSNPASNPIEMAR